MTCDLDQCYRGVKTKWHLNYPGIVDRKRQCGIWHEKADRTGQNTTDGSKCKSESHDTNEKLLARSKTSKVFHFDERNGRGREL